MSNCKKCQSNQVETFKDDEILLYKGIQLPYRAEYSVCQNCGREFVSTVQIKANDCRVREAKKAYDGLLLASEIKDAREKLNLTQEQAALVFGGGKKAFSKYERGEVSQSVAMDTLIRVYLNNPKIFKKRLAEVGLISAFIQVAKQNIIYQKQQKTVKLRLVKSFPSKQELKYG